MAYVAIALFLYQTFAHITVLLGKLPPASARQSVLRLGLILDTGLYGALYVYAGNVAPASPWRFVLLGAWAANLAYSGLFLLASAAHRKKHGVPLPGVYAEDALSGEDLVRMVIDALAHAIGALFLLRGALTLAQMALAIAAATVAYLLVWWRPLPGAEPEGARSGS